MADFVETATLKVTDQSSANIAKIRKSLSSLRKEADSLRKAFSGIQSKAISTAPFANANNSVKALKRNIDALAASMKSIKPMKNMAIGGASIGSLRKMNDQLLRLNANSDRAFRKDARFPKNILPIANREFGYMANRAGRATMHATGESIASTSTQNFLEEIQNLPAELKKNIRSAVADASKNLLIQDETSLRQTARSLAVNLAPGEDLAKATTEIAKGISAVTFMKGTENGQRFGEQLVKAVDRMGRGTTTEEVGRFSKAAAQSQIIAERDLNFQQVLNGVRRLGRFAQTMDDIAYGDFVLNVDAAGLQASNNLRTFMSDMTRENLNKGTKAQLNKVGIGQGSTLKDQELLLTNPTDYILKYFLPILQKQKGLDLDNAAATNTAILKTFQMNPSAMNMVSTVITQREQIARDREKRSRIDLEKTPDAAYKSITGAIKAVEAQWKNLSNRPTQLIDNTITPLLASFAKSLNSISRGEITPGTIGGAIGAVGVTAGALALSNPEIASLGVAGLRLNSAASALIGAAATQKTAGLAGAAGGIGAAGDVFGAAAGKGKGALGMARSAIGFGIKRIFPVMIAWEIGSLLVDALTTAKDTVQKRGEAGDPRIKGIQDRHDERIAAQKEAEKKAPPKSVFQKAMENEVDNANLQKEIGDAQLAILKQALGIKDAYSDELALILAHNATIKGNAKANIYETPIGPEMPVPVNVFKNPIPAPNIPLPPQRDTLDEQIKKAAQEGKKIDPAEFIKKQEERTAMLKKQIEDEDAQFVKNYNEQFQKAMENGYNPEGATGIFPMESTHVQPPNWVAEQEKASASIKEALASGGQAASTVIQDGLTGSASGWGASAAAAFNAAARVSVDMGGQPPNTGTSANGNR